MSRKSQRNEKFCRMCRFYWKKRKRQVIMSRLEASQCIVGSPVVDGRPVIAVYDTFDHATFAREIVNVGAESVRTVTYRNSLGSLAVPEVNDIIEDMRTDFTKQRRWNRRKGKGSQGR